MLNSAQTELRSAGYQVIFSNSSDRFDDEAQILRQLLDDEVAGLDACGQCASPTEETLAILARVRAQGDPYRLHGSAH